MSALEDMQSRYKEAHGRLWGDEPPRRVLRLPQPPVFVVNVPVEPPPPRPVVHPPHRPRWRRIIAEVCAKYKITAPQLIGRQRPPLFILARQEACFRMHEESAMSLPEIGRRLGGRDHTTVLYSIRRHRSALDGVNYVKRKPPVEARLV